MAMVSGRKGWKLMPRLSKLVRSRSLDQMRRSSISSSDSSDYVCSDEDDQLHEENIPLDVPKGYLAVYVGKQRRRFVLEATRLNHPLFKALLDISAQEFGFNHIGGVWIACEEVLFGHFLWLLQNDEQSLAELEIQELLAFYNHDS